MPRAASAAYRLSHSPLRLLPFRKVWSVLFTGGAGDRRRLGLPGGRAGAACDAPSYTEESQMIYIPQIRNRIGARRRLVCSNAGDRRRLGPPGGPGGAARCGRCQQPADLAARLHHRGRRSNAWCATRTANIVYMGLGVVIQRHQ